MPPFDDIPIMEIQVVGDFTTFDQEVQNREQRAPIFSRPAASSPTASYAAMRAAAAADRALVAESRGHALFTPEIGGSVFAPRMLPSYPRMQRRDDRGRFLSYGESDFGFRDIPAIAAGAAGTGVLSTGRSVGSASAGAGTGAIIQVSQEAQRLADEFRQWRGQLSQNQPARWIPAMMGEAGVPGQRALPGVAATSSGQRALPPPTPLPAVRQPYRIHIPSRVIDTGPFLGGAVPPMLPPPGGFGGGGGGGGWGGIPPGGFDWTGGGGGPYDPYGGPRGRAPIGLLPAPGMAQAGGGWFPGIGAGIAAGGRAVAGAGRAALGGIRSAMGAVSGAIRPHVSWSMYYTTLFAGYEVSNAMRIARETDFQAARAGTPTEMLERRITGIRGMTSGILGSIAGGVLDLSDWTMGTEAGPSRRIESLQRELFTINALDSARDSMISTAVSRVGVRGTTAFGPGVGQAMRGLAQARGARVVAVSEAADISRRIREVNEETTLWGNIKTLAGFATFAGFGNDWTEGGFMNPRSVSALSPEEISADQLRRRAMMEEANAGVSTAEFDVRMARGRQNAQILAIRSETAAMEVQQRAMMPDMSFAGRGRAVRRATTALEMYDIETRVKSAEMFNEPVLRQNYRRERERQRDILEPMLQRQDFISDVAFQQGLQQIEFTGQRRFRSAELAGIRRQGLERISRATDLYSIRQIGEETAAQVSSAQALYQVEDRFAIEALDDSITIAQLREQRRPLAVIHARIRASANEQLRRLDPDTDPTVRQRIIDEARAQGATATSIVTGRRNLELQEVRSQREITDILADAFGPGAEAKIRGAGALAVRRRAELQAAQILEQDRSLHGRTMADEFLGLGASELRRQKAEYLHSFQAVEGRLFGTALESTTSARPEQILEKINENISALHSQLSNLVAGP